jgi:radical SAM superfamily enzyme YgiQ (UPF0313 family)
MSIDRKVKVALVAPKTGIVATCPPLNLACIAGYLQREIPSCQVVIVDGEAGHDIYKSLSDFQPDIVGVTASTAQALIAYSLGDWLRQNRPDVYTVIGGVHASALPSEALEHFDCVVVGEGEIVFARIVQSFIDGKRVCGIIQGVQVEDLNTLPAINFDLLDIKEYLKHGVDYPLLSNPCLTIIASRGCLFRCPFCYNSSRTTRVRYVDAERISEEILTLHNKYNVNHFFFGDDDFLINGSRLKELKEKFDQKGISKWIKFGCQSRSNTLTVPTLELAKSLGCVIISIGLESGCERTLNYLKQGTTTLAANEQALKNCAKVGILAGGNFIYGVFDQTFDEMKESFSWMKKQKTISFVGTGVIIPYPGTDVWRKSQELKLLPEKIDYSRLFLTYNVNETYVINQAVPLRDFSKFMVNTARMARLYAKRNFLKSWWRFTVVMCKRPVFYWAWLFHPRQMFSLAFQRKSDCGSED